MEAAQLFIECINSPIIWLAIGSVAIGLIQHAGNHKPTRVSHKSIGTVSTPRKPII